MLRHAINPLILLPCAAVAATGLVGGQAVIKIDLAHLCGMCQV